MPYYRQAGDVPHKRHTVARDAAGALRFEELVGAEGFSADSVLLYHRSIPAAVVAAEPWTPPEACLRANAPLRNRHLQPDRLGSADDLVTGRQVLLGNDDVTISFASASGESELYRNAIGDECVFVQDGEAIVETQFGALAVGAGDYVVLPRGAVHRWLPAGLVRALVIESAAHIAPPRRYLSEHGQFLEHAPYCERDLRAPSEPLLAEGEAVDVLVKHRTTTGLGGTRMTFARHPFDVVGWDGCLYPFAFNLADFEPITGRVHQPPPVHQVFEGPNFVVCNFVPRKVDYHPQSVPVPYYHSNVDSDEVLFYAGGDYEARKGSGVGLRSMTLHPGGLPHGPQPGAVERSLGVEFFDETAVMIDTFRPLGLGPAAAACEDGGYSWTWAR